MTMTMTRLQARVCVSRSVTPGALLEILLVVLREIFLLLVNQDHRLRLLSNQDHRLHPLSQHLRRQLVPNHLRLRLPLHQATPPQPQPRKIGRSGTTPRPKSTSQPPSLTRSLGNITPRKVIPQRRLNDGRLTPRNRNTPRHGLNRGIRTQRTRL